MSTAKPKLDASFVRELADILNDANLNEVEVEHDGLRIRVSKASSAAPAVTVAAPLPAAPVPAAPAPAAPEDTSPPRNAVTSPMVGTVYHAAEPGAKPFVNVGDKVKAGDTLMLIEAMKTFNPIEAPRAGTVTQFLAQDGQPVEYGEPLIVIE